MRVLLWLALRELWSRCQRSCLSLLALALSAGLVVATGSLGALMQASVATPAPLIGRPADLWVSSAYDVDYDLPANLAARVRAVSGVADVQPILRRPVRVHTPPLPCSPAPLLPCPPALSLTTGPSRSLRAGPLTDTLTLMGVDPAPYFAFHDLALAAGEFPTAESPGVVALAPWAFVRDLRLGSPVTVTAPSGDVALPVTGLLEVKSLAAAQQGLVLYAPLSTVAGLFGLHDAVTALEVRVSPGASSRRVLADLERALGPAYAVSAASRSGLGPQLWQRLVLGALVYVDALALVGAVSLVYAVFASAARARRRQVGLLRAVGAKRQQVLALLVIEAALLGLAGGGVGLATGFLFAQVGARLLLQGAGVPALPPLPASALLAAVTVSVLGSLAGGVGPALRAARLPPLDALRTVAPQFQQAGTVGRPARATGRGGVPNLLRVILAHQWGKTRTSSGLQLVIANLRREPRRAALIAVALALILAMALGNVGVLSLLGQELAATFARLAGSDYLVLPGLTTISLRELAGQDTSDVPPLDPRLLAALERLEDRVWLMRGATADVEALQVFPGQPTLLLDIEGYAHVGGFRFQAGNWPAALEIFRQGPAVLLAPVVARRLNVGLGDPVWLDTLQGPLDFRVAGIGDSEFTTCILDLADGVAYLGANEVNAVAIKPRPGADAAAVRRALLDAVQTHGGTLLSLGQATAQLRAMFDQAQSGLGLLIGVTGLVALLGVVNAMLASVGERRREIGLLRAVGATRQQVCRLILSEAALLGTAAALAGTALGWAVTFLFLGLARTCLGLSAGASPSLGLPTSASSSLAGWLPLLAASAIGIVLWPLLAMLSALPPALHAARLPVVQALAETLPE